MVSFSYKVYVDKLEIVINGTSKYRYLMYVPFKDVTTDKRVLVIMKSPSKADNAVSDKTINNVLSFCHEKYSGVYIANLFPCYETDSSKLSEFIPKSRVRTDHG
jgi:hypothetical protein